MCNVDYERKEVILTLDACKPDVEDKKERKKKNEKTKNLKNSR